MYWALGNGSGESFISKLLVVVLGSDPVRAFGSRSTSPTSIPSYCSGLLFSFLFVFVARRSARRLVFRITRFSYCRQPLRMFPISSRPVTAFPPSSILHDNEHTTDSDRAESIPLARTTRRIIRISNC